MARCSRTAQHCLQRSQSKRLVAVLDTSWRNPHAIGAIVLFTPLPRTFEISGGRSMESRTVRKETVRASQRVTISFIPNEIMLSPSNMVVQLTEENGHLCDTVEEQAAELYWSMTNSLAHRKRFCGCWKKAATKTLGTNPVGELYYNLGHYYNLSQFDRRLFRSRVVSIDKRSIRSKTRISPLEELTFAQVY